MNPNDLTKISGIGEEQKWTKYQVFKDNSGSVWSRYGSLCYLISRVKASQCYVKP